MPYVEGYGTWPFGEEWLWEAMATSYLPLLDVLEAAPELTLSLTPVLCDQLEAPGVPERFLAFLREVRPETHRRDIASAEDPAIAAALEHSARQYAAVADRFEALEGDLLGALHEHAAWTSSATHAVLPLLATDAGARLQLRTGVASHRERFGDRWRGGLWMPECAHAPWLDPLLEEAGVHATCVDLTDVFGMGAPEHLRPLRSAAGPLLVPLDREIVELVWSHHGYPSRGAYANTRRRTEYEHMPWTVDGDPYDPGPRARAGPRRRRRLRGTRGGAGARRRAERLRRRHRAARPLVARGRRVAGVRRRGVPCAGRRARAPRRRARADRAGRRARRRPAGHHVGQGARPVDVERAGGRRPRVRHARRGAAHRRPRRRREHRRRPRAAGAAGERLGLRRQRGARGALRARARRRHLAELDAALGGDATRVARGIAPRATPAALLAP
jgi:hypothetical protein